MSGRKLTSRVTLTDERPHRVGPAPGRKFFPGTRGAVLQAPGPYVVTTTLDAVPRERIPRALADLARPGRGRPKGTKFEAELRELLARVTAGEAKYTVATEIARRDVIEERVRDRADYLVGLLDDRSSGE